MTWERFGYICRKADADRQSHRSLAECLTAVEAEPACNLYGDKIPANTWPRTILDRLKSMQDEQEGQFAIDTYKNLTLSRHLEEPMRFKRMIAYLSYITFIFYVIVGIYQTKVTPSFIEAFENFGISVPNILVLYLNYWLYLFGVVSLLIFLTLLIGFKVRSLFKFKTGFEHSFVFKYLLFGRIRQSYSKLIEILQFPVQMENDIGGEISEHLNAVKRSNMNLSKEMQELIEIELRRLFGSCERQIKIISATIAIIIVASVFTFLVSAYSPIFIFGDIV